MAKRIVAMLIMSLLSLQANAARYDRQCEGISPVLFQKKLKELAHGLRQEMAEPTPPTENEAETLARLAECDAENAIAPATGGQHAPDPAEPQVSSLNGC
ncbi:hypothetical protein [Serratia marcescens]|uniref:hypothetical protein n=1 Tax=Serratia marcescens TaxID=615 RepID=UPI0013DAB953|nr:hypothetical protein [Serratia marcescens]